jgi:hypothetical protein
MADYTAPDETSELRFKPAYQSLITDVFRLRLHRCTIISTVLSSEIAEGRYRAFKPLDEGHQSDMRDLDPDVASLIRATLLAGSNSAHPVNRQSRH